jgi:hypothetical protein
MPIYTFQDTNVTNDPLDKNSRVEISMRISELDNFKLENPHMKQLIVSAPSIGDSHRLGRIKPDEGFRDVLKNVKAHHPSSRKKDGAKNTINTW